MTEQAHTESDLTTTARWTAAVRALEHRREDRLFDDPWAEALAGAEGAAWIAQRSPGSVVPIVLRTRYFDDFLLHTAHAEGLRQIVMLAAGLDTRAYRLSWPEGTRIFELDQATVLQHKAQVLSGARPACTERVAIEVDLTGPWQAALMAAGFDAAQPAAWLLEGFLFYLPNEATAPIFDALRALAAPGSRLGFDCINAAVLSSPFTKAWVEMQAALGAPWVGTLDDPVGFLAARGWEAALTQAGAPDANHGRWTLPVVPPTLPNFPHNWYVTARKV